MIATQTIVIQCYCDKCGAGQLQQLLQNGFMKKKSLNDMRGNVIECHNCGSKNEIEDVYTLLPNEFLIFSNGDLEKMKKDNSIQKYLDNEP